MRKKPGTRSGLFCMRMEKGASRCSQFRSMRDDGLRLVMPRICGLEDLGDLRVPKRHSAFVRHEVLLGDIGDIFRLVILR